MFVWSQDGRERPVNKWGSVCQRSWSPPMRAEATSADRSESAEHQDERRWLWRRCGGLDERTKVVVMHRVWRERQDIRVNVLEKIAAPFVARAGFLATPRERTPEHVHQFDGEDAARRDQHLI